MFFDGMNHFLISHQTAIVLNCIVKVEIGEAEFEAVTTFQESRCGDDARQRER
jgi:hypothetical protein